MNFKDLRERRVLQFLVTYVAVGWIGLEAVGLLVEQAVLPGWTFRVAFTLFLCGIPGALIVTWFHGAKGDQVAPPVEKWLLAVVAVFAVGASIWVGRSSMEPAADTPVQLTQTEDPRRVAVLYFGAQGGGEDAEFLAAGLTESLIDELSTVDSISVVSRNGSQLYREQPRPAPDSIGRALSVGTLVDGTVAVAGDRVRVTVSMINAEDGTQFENTRFERPRQEIFDLQDSLSLQVADFLRRRIGTELDRVVLRRRTSSREAWELLQQAAVTADRTGEYLEHGDVDAASRVLEEADGILARAEAADPSWVEPVTRRGWLAYRQSRLGGLDRRGYDEWTSVGLEHADRALAMAPEDASALELKGTLLYWRYLLNLIPDELESDQAFHSAEEFFRASGTPSAQASLSHLLLNKGDNELAYAAARNSYEADPFLENANLTLWRLASTQWTLGDERQARRWCDEGLRRFPEDFRLHQCQLMVLGMEGVQPDVAAAWQHYHDFVELSPPQAREVNERQGLQYMAMALVRAQLPDSARSVMVRGRAAADVDPTREVARLESIPRSWLGDWDEVTRLMGLYLSANPLQVDGYRNSLAENAVPWYHRALQDRADFRSLLGLN